MANPPDTNRDSTPTGSASTVTNGASVHQHGPPAAVHHDTTAGGPSSSTSAQSFSHPVTVTAPTTTMHIATTTATSSAVTLTCDELLVVIQSGGQHPSVSLVVELDPQSRLERLDVLLQPATDVHDAFE